ncbi:MAG TPA: OmpA family protein [Acetobacteraceae bacterium]|nr:OmpA family protein [Acetobacteraceae bacterium]
MERRRNRAWQHRSPNHERWMISYADMLTLLLSVFIVLWASASTDKAKLEREAAGLLQAFTGTPVSIVPLLAAPRSPFESSPKPISMQHASKSVSPPSIRPVGAAKTVREVPPPRLPPATVRAGNAGREQDLPVKAILPLAEQRRLQPIILAMSAIREQIQHLLAPEIASHQIEIFRLPLAIRIRLNAQILFDTGEAVLTGEALTILDPIGDVLAHVPAGYIITIQGYTDDRPIHTTAFASNWELSAARAISVVKLFLARGVPGEALSAQGYAMFQPIASNATPDGRAKNRRVEIVISAPKPAKAADGG